MKIGTLEEALKKFFGYNNFRPDQKEIVEALLEGKDVVAILPTGAGKSICYQLPAMLMPGVAIVISPLISLMQDQVVSLSKNDLPAAFLNSSLPYDEIQSVMNHLDSYKLLYIAPERFSDPNFIRCLEGVPISLFAIDEAHCISQWGHSFRPEYRQLSILKKKFPKSAIIALTATATRDVERDITEQLAMTNPFVVKASFDRPNLTLRIYRRTDRNSQLLEFLAKHPGEAGIIYAATRSSVDEIYTDLQRAGFKTGKYHAGLSDDERTEAQHNFVHGECLLMVATVAFGMGIHKPDIRYVVHVDMPKSIEQYYQEIGRAGRDGLPSECLMLYSAQEIRIYKFFLEKIEDPIVRRTAETKTEKIYSLCRSTSCRRKELLRYFGENNSPHTCGNCDNCLDDSEQQDGTIIAQKILSCVYRLDQKYGVKHVIDVLRGAKTQSIFQKGHDRLSTFNLMAEYKETDLRDYIEILIDKKLLSRTDGEYPALQWTEATKSVIHGKEKVMMPKKIRQVAKRKEEAHHDEELFKELSQLRRKIALEAQVPAFVVFGDRTLIEMAKALPTSREEMMEINGVGPIKWQKYGPAFLSTITDYSRKK